METILASVRSEGKIAIAVASSGIASLLLPGGKTLHSRFKIPIKLDKNSVCNISGRSALADLIRRADVIVWDEAPMSHLHAFECMNRSLQVYIH